MKQRLLVKRLIAMILAVAMLVTGIPMTTVYAAGDDIKFDALSELKDALEEQAEVNSDIVSSVSAGDWGKAIFYDMLPWNFFHNRVQADIVAHNIGKVTKEKKNPIL